MPSMGDKRFARSVIYMCAHSDEGAMGLIINRSVNDITFTDLLDRLEIITGPSKQQIIDDKAVAMPIHLGGPVETGRGFVLHTEDYLISDSTLPIDDGICLTANVDILKAIAKGEGPNHAILALGYAGWSPGQLDSELQANGWLNCPADSDLVFSMDLDAKYERAMAKIGVSPDRLVGQAGHA